jgi:hypothetical protein
MRRIVDAVEQIVQIVEPFCPQIEDVDARCEVEGQFDLAGEAHVAAHFLEAKFDGAALLARQIRGRGMVQRVIENIRMKLARVQRYQLRSRRSAAARNIL